MADNSQRIKEIRKILQSGLTSSTVDGTTFTYDLDALRSELNQLIREDDSQRMRKPRITSINIARLF